MLLASGFCRQNHRWAMDLCPISSHLDVFELTERRVEGHCSAPVSARYLEANPEKVGRRATSWGFRHDNLPLPMIRLSRKGNVSPITLLTDSVQSLVCVE